MRQSSARVQLRPGSHAATRPLGAPTRGKTRANRLRGVDAFLLRYAEALIRREDSAFAGAWTVDLGYGDEPATTLELARSLRRVNPQARVLGVEIDPARVAAAQPFADALTAFRLGGFNLPLQVHAPGVREAGGSETVRLIRAFNVLRQYDEASVLPAWQQMAAALLPGGLLLEGTSDPLGRLWVANLLRRSSEPTAATTAPPAAPTARLEALVFGTSFKQPFDPAAFHAVLPKNLIHRTNEEGVARTLLGAWLQAAQRTVALRDLGQRQWFAAAADQLAQQLRPAGFVIDTRRKWLRSGILCVALPAADSPVILLK